MESSLSGYDYGGIAQSESGRVSVDGNDVGQGARLTGNETHQMELSTKTGSISLGFGKTI